MTDRPVFPFDAVVGQDDAKLALRLAALDPLIGGVLLRGEKGSAKTTLARGLAALLGDAPFVELPLGATEDRLVGTLDVHSALTSGETRFEPGLLADADGGVLYVDEINLLPDHLVDVLLDVAVSGENVVERDAVSHRHPARFVLVGSMNPEEGELRPQLLDRFGLCVSVSAPREVADRVESVRRRLAFDAGDTAAGAPPGRHGGEISDHADLPAEVVEAAAHLALAVGAEGLRADLTLCRAAVAHARLWSRSVATDDDLRRVAHLVLAHRSRRGPFDPPVVPPEVLDDALDDVLPPPEEPDDLPSEERQDQDESPEAETEAPPTAGSSTRPLLLGAPRRPPVPDARRQVAARGRTISDAPAGPSDHIAVVPSVRALAARRRSDPDATIQPDDLRAPIRVAPRRRTIVLCVDLSGSMGATERAEAATGTVLGLLTDAYEGRNRVALVTFSGDGARTVLEPTSSIEVARHRLDDLVTGGPTPLADGLAEAARIVTRELATDHDVLLAILTDGRATDDGGVDRAREVAARLAVDGVDSLVLDCETGPHRLGLAADLAAAMGARHVPVADLAPAVVAGAVRAGRRLTMPTLGPRLVVAGTASGVGKTTVATGIMAALVASGRAVAAAKVGPDFIDPGYHSLATGRPPRNLDPWICGIDVIPALAARAGANSDLLVVEGVMGLFDGADDRTASSTADVARLIDAPVILVVDATGVGGSVAATVRGFRDHDTRVRLAGVVCNKVGSERHATILREALGELGVPLVGCLPRDDAVVWRDRHLGLVPVVEATTAVAAALDRLAVIVAAGLDLDLVEQIAGGADTIRTAELPVVPHAGRCRIAVAAGSAFSFTYTDNIETLEAAGAEIVAFDPLHDEMLPDGTDALIVGGGFPEVVAPRLAQNVRLMAEVAERIGAGLPTWAECGGMLWLAETLDGHRMAGVLPTRATMDGRITLGYRRATTTVASPVGPSGTALRGHEHHHSVCDPGGDALLLESRHSTRGDGFATATLLASYLHHHAGGDPAPSVAFVAAADARRPIEGGCR